MLLIGFLSREDAEETPEPKKDHEKKKEAAEVWCNYDSDGTYLVDIPRTKPIFFKDGRFSM